MPARVRIADQFLIEGGMDLGVATHFSQGWDLGLAAEVRALGADHVRDAVRWEAGEAVPGTYAFEGLERSFPDRLAEAGIDTRLVYLARHPGYEGGATVTTEAGIAALTDYIATSLTRFGAVATIEIGNEFNAANFVWGPLKEAGYEERAAAHARIVTGVRTGLEAAGQSPRILGGAAHSVPVDYLAAAAEAGLLDAVDGIALHPYTSPPEHVGEHLALLRARLEAPDLAIHATEYGRETETAAGAARHLVKMTAALAASGVESATWYALAEQRWFPNMGLVEPDGTPRPAADAFALMAERVLPLGPARRLEAGPQAHAIAFGDRGLVIWGAPRDVSLPGAEWLDSRGQPVAAPRLDPARPLVAIGAQALDFQELALGSTAVRADSFFDFSLNEGPAWSRSVTLPSGEVRVLEALGGGKPGAPWRPYLGIDWLRPLQVTEWTVLPANFEPGNEAAGHTVTETLTLPAAAETGSALRLCGFLSLPADSADGVALEIRTAEGTLLGRRLAPGDRMALDMALPDVRELAFAIHPGASATGDRVRRRYVVTSAEDCPPVAERL